MDNQRPIYTSSAKVRGWAVHLFSASGAVLAVLALVAIDQQRWTDAMLWLFVALVVDGMDGTLARSAHVGEVVPQIDGAVLDLVIDYLNYVFVPTIFLLEARLLPGALALPLAALIQLSSLYVFARRDMKTSDSYFRGFPALWNIVALYLFAAEVRPEAGAVIVAALVILSFAPIHFVHPFRVRDYGYWLPALAAAWAATTVALLFDVPESWRPTLFPASAISAVLLVGMGLWRTFRGPRAEQSS